MKLFGCLFIITAMFIFSSCKNSVEPENTDPNEGIKKISGHIENWPYADSLQVCMGISYNGKLIFFNKTRVNSDGSFTMSLDAPPVVRPVNISDPNIHKSDSTAEFTTVDYLMVIKDNVTSVGNGISIPTIYKYCQYKDTGRGSDMSQEHRYTPVWVYTSKPFKLNGSTNILVGSLTYNLELKSGWNIMIEKAYYENGVLYMERYADDSLVSDWYLSN